MITEGVEDCDEISKVQGKRLLKAIVWLPPQSSGNAGGVVPK